MRPEGPESSRDAGRRGVCLGRGTRIPLGGRGPVVRQGYRTTGVGPETVPEETTGRDREKGTRGVERYDPGSLWTDREGYGQRLGPVRERDRVIPGDRPETTILTAYSPPKIFICSCNTRSPFPPRPEESREHRGRGREEGDGLSRKDRVGDSW